MTSNNPDLDLVNINTDKKSGEILFICSQDIERKQNSDIIEVLNHEYFNDHFCCCVFLSDLLRNILKCNCSQYSTLMTMYLPGAMLRSNEL